MKKYFIFAVAALVSLAACSKVNTLEVTPLEDNAVSFEAYTATSATKGHSIAKKEVVAPDEGIGVFAFYQPSNGGVSSEFNTKKFAIPDFMYNQQVVADTSSSTVTWSYNPVKYWPNNSKDLVSFFAYAPYDAAKAWDDLGIKTDASASKLTTSFPVYNDKASMIDYLFAKPVLNQSKPATGNSAISFNFNHIMSRIGIHIGVNVDGTSAPGTTTAMAWTDSCTVITVESIEFKGIAESYDYTYTIATKKDTLIANGSQDLKLTKDEDFQNNVIDTASFKTAGYKDLLKMEGTPADSAYLFIAPQNLTSSNLVITYTVKTVDPKNNAANNSTVTNVIEAPIGVDFKSGFAYTLKLLIGMKTVMITADVVDWTTGSTQYVYVPENK